MCRWHHRFERSETRLLSVAECCGGRGGRSPRRVQVSPHENDLILMRPHTALPTRFCARSREASAACILHLKARATWPPEGSSELVTHANESMISRSVQMRRSLPQADFARFAAPNGQTPKRFGIPIASWRALSPVRCPLWQPRGSRESCSALRPLPRPLHPRPKTAWRPPAVAVPVLELSYSRVPYC